MSWAEFRIRLFSYKRQQKEDWYKVREIAWNALIAPHQNPKKIPKRKELFIPLEPVKKKTISPIMLKRILEVKAEYNEKIKSNG